MEEDSAEGCTHFRKPSTLFGSANWPVTAEFDVSGETLYLAGQKKNRRIGLNVGAQGLTRESFHTVYQLSPNENS
jgi:hypothetical protein